LTFKNLFKNLIFYLRNYIIIYINITENPAHLSEPIPPRITINCAE